MTLPEGAKLGRYEVRAKIGVGGMGEVYLAEDVRLHRKVALKILPPELASYKDRMRRFEQEATATAALNHPHIAHIYEIGEAIVSRGGSSAKEDSTSKTSEVTRFIAMEFIDGHTLRELIHGQQTELRRLLRFLQQVAEGLAKAHAMGIVHRDLKPDNIMITKDGFAKILDFGLAKLVEPQRTFSSGSVSDEVSTVLLHQPSVTGHVMGTIGYMSPEQALGRVNDIDYRTDIFAFGCILFEAATRQRAFHGQDDIDSLHKIVHGPTPQLLEFDPSVPEQIDRIVRRCLAKDPDKRYQAIKDIALELEEVQHDLQDSKSVHSFARLSPTGQPSSLKSHLSVEGRTATIPSGVTNAVSSAEYLVGQIKQHKVGVFLLAGTFIFSIAALVFLLNWVVSRPDARDEIKTRPALPPPQMKINRLTGSGKIVTAAISQDGKFLAYVESEGDAQSLWTKQILTNSNVKVVPAQELTYSNVTFTPDGNYIYYSANDETSDSFSVFRVPTLGGTPTKILDQGGRGLSFSPDGQRFVLERYDSNAGESSLIVATADGSSSSKLASLAGHEWFAAGGPAWSPNGNLIACATGDDRQDRQMTMTVFNVADGRSAQLTGQRWDAIGRSAWLADGSGIVFCASDSGTAAARQIWQITYPSGEARRVTYDLNSYLDLSIAADSKTLVASQRDRTAAIWVAPDAVIERVAQVTTGHNDGGGGLAWVGQDRLIYVSIASGNTEVWIMNSDGSGQKQLTNDSFFKYSPAVTPSGRYVVFVSQSGGIHLWRMDLDGSNILRLTRGNYDNNPRISPDGQWVVYSSYLSGKLALWRVPIAGGEPSQITEVFATEPDVSPDGKLVASLANDAEGKPTILIVPLAGGAPVKSLPLPSTIYWDAGPRWTPDGNALTYVDRRGNTMNLWLQPLAGGPPKQLTDFKEGGIMRREWSSDGKRVAVVRGLDRSDVVIISNFD